MPGDFAFENRAIKLDDLKIMVLGFGVFTNKNNRRKLKKII